ncbi:MAG: DUF1080 domain-containing protein [Verrucomicrobiota bacterium]|nr:DUF1080 domain-containing protein [Verrucomicrobiota bacterium]
MTKHTLFIFAATAAYSLTAAKPGAFTDPATAGPEYQVQGAYAAKGHGAQVIALGDGKFRAVLHQGGLPGDGWDKKKKTEINGQTTTGGAAFEGGDWKGSLTGKTLTLIGANGDAVKLEKVTRKSPTLGMKPPKGAVVLFDGKSAKNFKPGKTTEDGLLMEGANSVARFQDHTLHIEFRLPFQPKARGQGRGNSGCYLQARYEVQMLDSFGLKGNHNECGGIYSIKPPDVNMCFPPLSWQTYDVEFAAAKYDGKKKISNARMTVRHNGVVIHDNVELPKRTTASPLPDGPDPGFLHLQNHGNPVRYRNIWVVEKK